MHGIKRVGCIQKELGGGVTRVGTLQAEGGGQRSLACGAISVGWATEGGAYCVWGCTVICFLLESLTLPRMVLDSPHPLMF